MKAAMNRNLHVSFELTMPNRSSWNGRWSGYDWMIDSLRWYGKIMNDSQRKAHIEASKSTGAT